MKITEMEKLAVMLMREKVEFNVNYMYEFDNAPQIILLDECGERFGDVICHKFSYGGKDGLLEYMGVGIPEEVGDDVEGYLTANEAFQVIIRGLEEITSEYYKIR